MQSLSTPPHVAHETDNNSYIIDDTNKIMSTRKGGRLNQSTIVKYDDGTEWVLLTDKLKERFCGFLYLQNAIKESGLNNVKPAENKMSIHGQKIIYLSRYCGEEKPKLLLDHSEELLTLKKDIGFTDIAESANLRKRDGKVYVFDTEKRSFKSDVHGKIDSFVHSHDAILKSLEMGSERGQA